MAIAATYLTDASFSAAGDLTAELAPNVRVKADCGPDGMRYGTVASASAQDGVTTVALTMDAAPLTTNLSGVWHGNDDQDSLVNHAAQHAPGGRDPLATATTDAPGVVELATPAEGVAGTDPARAASVAALRQAYRSWQRDDLGRFAGIIPPAYNLFAPNLALPGATTFSRASSGWLVGAAGLVREAAVSVPRFDYDAGGDMRGLLIEGAATRVNTIAAAPTAPENVAVTAQIYTISFYGTGSVALSGAHAATVAGAGALPVRRSYTFTPTAGTLTLTPSGMVQHLQVETGPVATSPILGDGSQVARAADVATAALSGIEWNAAEGAVFVTARTAPGAPGGSATQAVLQIDDGTNNNRILVDRNSSRQMRCIAISGGAAVAALVPGAVADATDFRLTFSWRANEFLAALNAGADVTDMAGAVPSGLTTARLGASLSGALPWFGAIKHLALFPRALTAAQRQAMAL